MEPLIKCSVCLIQASNLVKISETDSNSVTWIGKLKSCVPEGEWTEKDQICPLCIGQLETACAFRNLCLYSVAVRKQLCKNLKDETICEDSLNYSDVTDTGDLNCDEPFDDQDSLIKFNEVQHNQECSYDCCDCDINCVNCEDHDHECDICNTSFKTAVILHKHQIIEHTTPNKWKYSCPHCSRNYPFESCRDVHIKRLHAYPNDEFRCFHCDESYCDKVALISHIQTEHTETKSTKRCRLCLGVYNNQILLENHLRQEHNVGTAKRLHQCQKCFGSYTTEKVLNDHYVNCDGIKRHNNIDLLENQKIENVKDEEPQIKEESQRNPSLKKGRKKLNLASSNTCHVCGMIFNTGYLAKRHVRNVHATEKNYKCDVCEQKFASPVYLNAHKRYHSGERPHICAFCGKGFITGSDLYHHEKIHANKRAYKCDKCPKAFNTSSDLHKHKLCVHQDRSEWKYVCGICERRFPLKTNLDAHTKTHTGERNFACHLCERRCVNRSVLLRHISSHSNVRLYKCNVCSMEYKYQKSLDIHMAKAHGIGDVKIPERVKKYFCHICPKSYFANNKLQKHIRTHTGERPFSCDMCDKRFIDKSYIKQHLKSAHHVIFCETDIV